MMNTNSELRTDIDKMDDKQVKDWIDMIIRNTHYLDLMNLYETLENKLETNKLATLFDRVYKMCDKCEITYPEHIVVCHKCGTTAVMILNW